MTQTENIQQDGRFKSHRINNYINCQWTKSTNVKPRIVKTGYKSKTKLSCLQDTHFNYKDPDSLQVKEQKHIYHVTLMM